MKTITEAAKITGIIPQRINDYEKAGLLEKPIVRNKYKYRLYSDKEIVRLWQIRFYKELGYTIPQMKKILDNPDYRPEVELSKLICELEEKKKQIDSLLDQAKTLRQTGLDVSLSYELIPAVREFSYDEAAKISFPLWNKGALAGMTEGEEDDTGDGLFEDLDAVAELFDNGVSPSSPEVQNRLQGIKQQHRIPLVSIQCMLRIREMKDNLCEIYGDDIFQALAEALKIAARTEATEAQVQAEASIAKLLNIKNDAPDSEDVQAEVAAYLRAVSYGVGVPKNTENPTEFEIEMLEAVVKQYADRDSAFYASASRRRHDKIGKEKLTKEAKREAAKKADAEVARLYAQASETLAPALRVYLKNMKEKAENRNAGYPDQNE